MDNFEQILKLRELYNYAEQLCQSENTKREITEVAISKIPYVVYPELDTNQNLIIHEFAEYLLTKAKDENDHNEVAVTYDLDNNLSLQDGLTHILEKAGKCTGGLDETDLFSDTQTMSTIYRAKNVAVVNLHNHPSCSSFSVQDLSFFLTETAIKLMVVIGNNGELYYLSKDSDKYNFENAMKYFTDIPVAVHPNFDKNYKWSNSELREIADIFLKSCREFGIDYKHILGSDRELKKKKERGYDYDER